MGPAGKRSYAHAPPSPRLSLCLCLCVCLSVCLSFSLYLPPSPHVRTRPFRGLLLRSPLLAALQGPRPLTPSPRPLRPSPSWPGSSWWPRRAILKEEASGLCSRWHEFHCHRLRKSLSCTRKERAGTSLFRGAPPLGGRRALTRDGDGPHHTDQLSWFKSSSSTGRRKEGDDTSVSPAMNLWLPRRAGAAGPECARFKVSHLQSLEKETGFSSCI